eukprot:gene131-9744_t
MSKESEVYKKSVIDIHIKFDPEKEKEFRAILGEKFGLRPACIKNVPEILDKEGILEKDFEKRSTEVKKFRKQSQSALISPLLNMALVKKTKKFLNSKKLTKQELKPIQKFRSVARLVLVFVALSTRWKRYKISTSKRGRINSTESSSSRYYEKDLMKPSEEKSIGKLDSIKNGRNKGRVSDDIQLILRKSPDQRTNEDLAKVQRFCRKIGVLSIFPVERQTEVAQRLGYECYDKGRVLSIQGRDPIRIYYILGGKVNMIKSVELTDGIRKRYFGEIRQGNLTEANEVELTKPRACSLVAKCFVEVLVIEKEDFMDLIHCKPEFEDTSGVFLKKDTIVVKDIENTPYFYVVKSGACKLLQRYKIDEEGVPLVKKGFLPKMDRASFCHGNLTSESTDEHETLKEAKKLYEDVSTFLNGTKEWKQEQAKRASVSIGCPPKSLHLTVPQLRDQKGRRKRKALPTLGELVFGRQDVDSGTISSLEDSKQKGEMGLKLPFITMNASTASSTSSATKNSPRNSIQLTTLLPQRKRQNREAYFQVGSLKAGDIYGLESISEQAVKIIQPEINMHVPQITRSKAIETVVVSEGSECILVDKKLFLKKADFFTLSRIATMDQENSPSNDASLQIEKTRGWESYKKNLLDDILNQSKPRKKKLQNP